MFFFLIFELKVNIYKIEEYVMIVVHVVKNKKNVKISEEHH